MQISGGNADNSDIKNGEIEISNTIIRECKEELNIDLLNRWCGMYSEIYTKNNTYLSISAIFVFILRILYSVS